MNLINQLTGVIIDKEKVKFGHMQSVQECMMDLKFKQMESQCIEIQDIDSYAKFDDDKWMVEWFEESIITNCSSLADDKQSQTGGGFQRTECPYDMSHTW